MAQLLSGRPRLQRPKLLSRLTLPHLCQLQTLNASIERFLVVPMGCSLQKRWPIERRCSGLPGQARSKPPANLVV